MGRYHTLVDGEWATPSPSGIYKIACCDCGLIHYFQIRRTRGGFTYRAFRDQPATIKRRARHGRSLTAETGTRRDGTVARATRRRP